MTALDLLEAARLKVWNKHPYIGAVLMSLRFVEMPGIGTLAVDSGWRLYYDPKTVVEWSHKGIELLAGAVCHECWHVLRDHFTRRQDRDPQLWNLANDAEINSDITHAGWKLPVAGVMPSMFGMTEGLLAEEYYLAVLKNVKKITITCQCGGCAGNPFEWEESNDHAKGDGKEGSGVKPMPAFEQEVIRRQAAQDVQQAVKSIGNVPTGLAAWAERELKPPTIDWRKQLASLVKRAVSYKAGAVDHTYRKSSRRGAGLRHFLGANCPILPSLHCPVPSVAMILDVSGSMMGGPAEAARGEVMGVVKALGFPCIVFVADTRIAGKRRVATQKDIALLGETLGGTDIAHAVKEVDQQKKYDVLVVLTDGETGWHERGSAKATVLAAITPDGTNPPEYVKSVRMV